MTVPLTPEQCKALAEDPQVRFRDPQTETEYRLTPLRNGSPADSDAALGAADPDFCAALDYVSKKNAELYRRLA